MLSLHIKQDDLSCIINQGCFHRKLKKIEEDISSVVKPAYLWRLSCCDSAIEVK